MSGWIITKPWKALGWYILDRAHQVIAGPFDTRRKAQRHLREIANAEGFY